MAVDVQAITSSYEQKVRDVRTETLLGIHDLLAQELADHPDHRDAVLGELRQLRRQFAEAGREDMEDIILDAMDMFSGWCARSMRI